MVAAEQNAEHERGKGIGRDQPGGLGLKEGEDAAVAENEQDLRGRKLQIDDAENEKERASSARNVFG